MDYVEMIFWLSVVGILYAYAGYPVLLGVTAYVRKKRPPPSESCGAYPSVSIIISVYNEEQVIRAKIQNCLDLKYPREKLEIIVASDGSTDRTHDEVIAIGDRRVRLIDTKSRQGKSLTLNEAVREASGEVIVFTDANAFFPGDAIVNIIRNLNQDGIGFVTGWTKYERRRHDPNKSSIGVYEKLEAYIKEKESLVSSCVGADGALFAIRKSLYHSLKKDDLNDLVTPFEIILRGYRGVFVKSAVCSEMDIGSIKYQFERQVRINARTIKAILSHWHLLNAFRFGWFSILLFSHKVMRLVTPLLLIMILGANIFLLQDSLLYLVSFGIQTVFYGSAWTGLQKWGVAVPPRVHDLVLTFLMVNSAVLHAWYRVLRGGTDVMWSPVREST